jgi:hypothetical protein
VARRAKDWKKGLLDFIAEACATNNRRLCRLFQQEPSPTWKNASPAMRESLRQGVRLVLSGALPRELHEAWLENRKAAGWKRGPKLDRAGKVHPDLVPWQRLPIGSQFKTFAFMETVAELMRVYNGSPEWKASKSAYSRTRKAAA